MKLKKKIDTVTESHIDSSVFAVQIASVRHRDKGLLSDKTQLAYQVEFINDNGTPGNQMIAGLAEDLDPAAAEDLKSCLAHFRELTFKNAGFEVELSDLDEALIAVQEKKKEKKRLSERQELANALKSATSNWAALRTLPEQSAARYLELVALGKTEEALKILSE